MPKIIYDPRRGLMSKGGGGFTVRGPIKPHTEELSIAAAGTATLTNHGVSAITTTGATGIVTLPNGTNIGDEKFISLVDDGGDLTLRVTTHETSSPEDFTGAETGDCILLKWGGTKWYTVANNGMAT